MHYSLCPYCRLHLEAEKNNGFTSNFTLNHQSQLLISSVPVGYELEQISMQVVSTCVTCAHSIYRITTFDGHRGFFIDLWDITT